MTLTGATGPRLTFGRQAVAVIVPSAKAVYLCEETDVEGGMTNLYALFNKIHPRSYPHVHDSFCVFAQLGSGLDEIRTHFDIRRASDDRLIHTSRVRVLNFERRTQVILLAIMLEGVRFEHPGVYVIELL